MSTENILHTRIQQQYVTAEELEQYQDVVLKKGELLIAEGTTNCPEIYVGNGENTVEELNHVVKSAYDRIQALADNTSEKSNSTDNFLSWLVYGDSDCELDGERLGFDVQSIDAEVKTLKTNVVTLQQHDKENTESIQSLTQDIHDDQDGLLRRMSSAEQDIDTAEENITRVTSQVNDLERESALLQIDIETNATEINKIKDGRTVADLLDIRTNKEAVQLGVNYKTIQLSKNCSGKGSRFITVEIGRYDLASNQLCYSVLTKPFRTVDVSRIADDGSTSVFASYSETLWGTECHFRVKGTDFLVKKRASDAVEGDVLKVIGVYEYSTVIAD